MAEAIEIRHDTRPKMKLLICVLGLVAIANAYFEFDMKDVKRRDIRIPIPFAEGILPSPDPRIVGGNETEPNAHPYQVATFILTAQGTFFCGGTLISYRNILTAAHCPEGASQIQVVLGAHGVLNNEATQQVYFTNQFQLHPGWNAATLTNDLAIITLLQEVIISQTVQIIPLPPLSSIGTAFTGSTGRITGWGLAYDGATGISEVLRSVDVNIISNLICNLVFLGIIQPTHLCTSGTDGVGACSGDSGGPLTLLENGQQIGTVSFGLAIGCEFGFPSAFTRITAFLNWIENNSDVIIQP